MCPAAFKSRLCKFDNNYVNSFDDISFSYTDMEILLQVECSGRLTQRTQRKNEYEINNSFSE